MYIFHDFNFSKILFIAGLFLLLGLQSIFPQANPAKLSFQEHDHSNCSRNHQQPLQSQNPNKIAGSSDEDSPFLKKGKSGKSDGDVHFKSEDCETSLLNYLDTNDDNNPDDGEYIIDYLRDDDWTGSQCLRRYFDADDPTINVIFDEEIADHVAERGTVESSGYSLDNRRGMYGLLTYLHIATNHNYGTDVLNYYEYASDFDNDDAVVIENLREFVQAMASYFADEVELYQSAQYGHMQDLRKMLILATEPSIGETEEVRDLIKSILEFWVATDWVEIASDENEWTEEDDDGNRKLDLLLNGTYEIFNIINRNTSRDDFLNVLAEDDELLNLLGELAVDLDVIATADMELAGSTYLFSEYAVKYLTVLADQENEVIYAKLEPHLLNIIDTYDEFSVEWYQAIRVLNIYGDCESWGTPADPEKDYYYHPYELQKDMVDFLFPTHSVFEDGDFEMRSSLNDDVVHSMYHASLQVKSQLFRLLGNDAPLPGDDNNELKIYIFDSEQDYHDFGNFLFGISTDNGGIYIESWATFFTFDRETGLSLEELFRHEYAHYLQGRYVVPGPWGSDEIYDDSRLVWFEEGMANFLAAATDVERIKFLRATAYNVERDLEEEDLATLVDVFNASYSGSSKMHYTYGSCAWMNWYLNEYDVIVDLFEKIQDGWDNIEAFDDLVNGLLDGEDSFQEFLEEMGSDPEGNSWEPETDWKYDDDLTVAFVDDIKNAILNMDLGGDFFPEEMLFEQYIEESFARFRITGRLKTQNDANEYSPEVNANLAVSNKLDDLMIQLRDDQPLINNLSYTVGYFKNVIAESDGFAYADFVIDGPLRDVVLGNDMSASFTASAYNVVENTAVLFENTTGGLYSYIAWDFNTADGLTGQSDSENPDFTFSETGEFTVQLIATVLDNNGVPSTSTATKVITVHPSINEANCDLTNIALESIHIEDFSFAGFENSTAPVSEGYNIYSNEAMLVQKGATDLPMRVNYDGWNFIAWIDFNGNNEFDEEPVAQFTGVNNEYQETTIDIPNDAVSGSVRMRLFVNGDGDFAVPDNCEDFSEAGEIEDYVIVIVDQNSTTANQAPTVELIKPISFSFMTSEPIEFEMIAQDDKAVVKATLELVDQEGINNTFLLEDDIAPFRFVDNFALNNLPVGTYNGTVTVLDAEGLTAEESFVLIIESNPDSYCLTQNHPDPNGDTFIKNVTLENINNSSSAAQDGYNNYTDQVANLTAGVTSILSLDANMNSWDLNTVGIWIDWNNDGDLTDKEDLVYRAIGDAGGDEEEDPYLLDITPPVDAVIGKNLRMRVRLGYSHLDENTACGNGGKGETEDYSVIVNEDNCYSGLDISQTNSGFTVTFTSSLSAINYDWNINGDEMPGNGSSSSYTFETYGVYEVCLTATNEDNCVGSLCQSVILEECKLNFAGSGFGHLFNSNPSIIVGPQVGTTNTSFVPSVLDDGPIRPNQGPQTPALIDGFQNLGGSLVSPGSYSNGCVRVKMTGAALGKSATDDDNSLRLIERQLGQLTITPNPAEFDFQINFDLTESSSLSIDIYDYTGSHLKNIARQTEFLEGYNSVNVQRGNLQSGIYLVVLKGDGFLQSARLMIN